MTAQVQAASLPQFPAGSVSFDAVAPIAAQDTVLRLSSSHLGEISWEAANELCFPAGLPGFEQARRMVPVEIPSQRPLVYLQSAENANICFAALPVLAVNPRFQLQISDDDQAALELDGETAMLGADVLCLALLIPCGSTVQTNLRAPIVINLHNGRGVQAVESRTDRELPAGLWRLSGDGKWEAVC